MGFKSRNGKNLSEEKDVENLKLVYKDLLEGYLNMMLVPEEGTLDTEHANPAIKAYQGFCKDFLTKFDEKSIGEEDVVIEDFYNNGILGVYSSFINWADTPEKKKDAYYRQFFKSVGDHFAERFSGNDIVSKDQGLTESMKSFKLNNEPMPGIKEIPDYDPSQPYDDPYIAARQANSDTYRKLLISNNPQAAQKGSEDFTIAAEFAKNAAVKLQNKESIGFGDLYDIFTNLNKRLRPDEKDGGKIRIEDIAAGTIKGINSAAIPADLFTTLSTVADYMNQIKQVQDSKVRKSQAVQLAAFAYQLTISEHVFGNGNGRSCRLLSDMILQTFGLPPQVPTYALVGTGATIGKPLDFEKGAKCFMRGLVIESDLMKVHKNAAFKNIHERATAYLKLEKIDTRILKTENVIQPDNTEKSVYKYLTPAHAINLAVQTGESKYSLATALSDFIKADHIGTWNSDQYKSLIETAKKTLMVLDREPVYSQKSTKAINNLETAITNYQDHCKRHPKNNKTRTSRLNAVADIKNSLANIKDVRVMVSSVEAAALKDELKTLNTERAKQFSEAVQKNVEAAASPHSQIDSDVRRELGKYILSDILIKEIESERNNFDLDEVKNYTEDEVQISHILEGNTIELAVMAAKSDPSYAGKSVQEKLSQIADCYKTVKTTELRAMSPDIQENIQKNENVPKENKPEERSIMNYI